MATYSELYSLLNDDALRNRVRVAVVVAAQSILVDGASTADQMSWAAAALGSPESEGQKAFRAVLAGNAAATVGQITGADDATLQAGVDAIVPGLIAAHTAAAV